MCFYTLVVLARSSSFTLGVLRTGTDSVEIFRSENPLHSCQRGYTHRSSRNSRKGKVRKRRQSPTNDLDQDSKSLFKELRTNHNRLALKIFYHWK